MNYKQTNLFGGEDEVSEPMGCMMNSNKKDIKSLIRLCKLSIKNNKTDRQIKREFPNTHLYQMGHRDGRVAAIKDIIYRLEQIEGKL